MLLFVESESDFKQLCDSLSSGSAFFQFIYDEKIHSTKNKPVALFIYQLETESTFVLSFSHPDVVPISYSCIRTLTKTSSKKYIVDKKECMYFTNLSEFVDISFDVYTKTLNQVKIKYPSCNDLRSLPIYTIKKSFDDTLKFFKYYIGKESPCNVKLLNDLCTAFSLIENHGLVVDRSEFKLGDVNLIDDKNKIFSQYNYFTPTTRPSNRFAKINFAALNKKKNEKDCFVSRYNNKGGLVMFDYESYHLRLFAEHINFNLPTSSLHEYFGKFYHNKDTLTEEEYEMSKKITFNLIFGGISADVQSHIPFMKKVAEYVEENWKKFQTEGYIETWKYKRVLSSEHYKEMNPYKLFNYLLQAAETERNCIMINKIHNLLDGKKSKLVLYHYDAFLLDMHRSEFILAKQLSELLSEQNKYPVRMYVGSNYGNMTEFKV